MNKNHIENPLSAFICELCFTQQSQQHYYALCCNKICHQGCCHHHCQQIHNIPIYQFPTEKQNTNKLISVCQMCDRSITPIYQCQQCKYLKFCEDCFCNYHDGSKIKHHSRKQVIKNGEILFKIGVQDTQLDQRIQQIYQKIHKQIDNINIKTSYRLKQYGRLQSQTKQNFKQILYELESKFNKIIYLVTQKYEEYRNFIIKRQKRQIQKLRNTYKYERLIQKYNFCQLYQKISPQKLITLYNHKLQIKNPCRSVYSIISSNLANIQSQIHKLDIKKVLSLNKTKYNPSSNVSNTANTTPQRYFLHHKANNNMKSSKKIKNDMSLSFGNLSFKKTRENKNPSYVETSMLGSETRIQQLPTFKKLKKIKSQTYFTGIKSLNLDDSIRIDTSIDDSFGAGLN